MRKLIIGAFAAIVLAGCAPVQQSFPAPPGTGSRPHLTMTAGWR